MKVREIMTRDVVTARPDTPVYRIGWRPTWKSTPADGSQRRLGCQVAKSRPSLSDQA